MPLNLAFSVVEQPGNPGYWMIQLALASPGINVGALLDPVVLRANLGGLFQALSEVCDQANAHNNGGGIVVAPADTLHTLNLKEHPHGTH
jgi:hypothetical protein